MPENGESVTIVTVESRHGTEPHKPFTIPKDGIDLVVRQSLTDINPGELVLLGLAQQAPTCQAKQ